VYRLTDAPRERRWARIAAAVLTAAMLLGFSNYFHYVLSSQSDPMIVALCLAAIDCHVHGRPRAAFVLGVLAALGRPEVWPFLGLYSLWQWRRRPEFRGLLIGGWVVVALLWFGIPALTSRSPFVAASNAMGSGRRLTSDKVFGTVGRFLSINELPVQLAALLAVVMAGLGLRRHEFRQRWQQLSPRDSTTLVLAAGVVLWVIIEIAFALHGWPALARYVWEAAGVLVVLAGLGIGRLLADRPPLPRLPVWAGIGLAVVIVAGLVPTAITHAREEHRDLKAQRQRTTEIRRLTPAINAIGGIAAVSGCGEPLTRLEYQTMLAYTLNLNVSRVGFKYGQAIAHGNPIVLFTPTSHGWLIQALHQTAPRCRALPQAH
jgi:heme exporter protein D